MRIADYLNRIKFAPKLGLILGSGLGNFADNIERVGELSYDEIDDFPKATVSGHAGKFVFGYIADKAVVIMQGRIHYYEGYSMQEVVKPIYAMVDIGITHLILTNASGGVNPQFKSGEIMVITDHIMSVENPLVGKNNDKYGVRFPDMSHIYDRELSDIIIEEGKKIGLSLREGLYLQTSGPSYETPAEIAMWGKQGVSAVGMSTACEALVARYCGVKVVGIACITNMAAGLGGVLSHEEVKHGGERASDILSTLIKAVIEHI